MNLLQNEYPKKIYINSEVYKVIFSRKMKDYGETDSGCKTIKIKAGMSKRETFKTFIHELLHVIEFENSHIKIKHKLIYKLEDAIYNLLVDNFI